MSSMSAAIIALLNASPEVVATVDKNSEDTPVPKIYNKLPDQDTQGKFIVINEITTSPNYALEGDAGQPYGQWQIDAYGDTDPDAFAIHNAVRVYLESLTQFALNGINFYEITFNSYNALSDQLNLGSAYNQHRYTMTIAILSSHPTT